MAEPYLSQLQQIVSRFDLHLAGIADLEVKHFFSGAALYVGGKICASLSPSGFALKLPENTRLGLLTKGQGTEFRFFPGGPIKTEYVALSKSVLENNDLLRELIVRSVNYVIGNINSDPEID